MNAFSLPLPQNEITLFKMLHDYFLFDFCAISYLYDNCYACKNYFFDVKHQIEVQSYFVIRMHLSKELLPLPRETRLATSWHVCVHSVISNNGIVKS